MTVYLVSCVAAKWDTPKPARELYCSGVVLKGE